MTPRQWLVGFLLVLGSALAPASPAYANMQAPPTPGEVARGYVLALVITVIIELAIAALLGVRTVRDLTLIALLNAITNPLFNVVLGALSKLDVVSRSIAVNWGALLLLEAIVVVVEWRVLLRMLGGEKWSSRRVLWLAIAMNAGSLIVGNVVLAFLDTDLGLNGTALARLTSASRRTALRLS